MKYLLPFLAFTAALHAATLPGFRVQKLGVLPPNRFLTSLAVDSKGTIYYSTTDGRIYRFAPEGSTEVAHVDTVAISDSGLLGMALRDDRTAVVHYTSPDVTHDVVSQIDLVTGEETVLLSLVGDIEVPTRAPSPEHRGGNPIVTRDSTIFVGLGDYGGGWVAAQPGWNGGRIWRIRPDGSAAWFALGFRNPFDIAWDEANARLIVPDNGTGIDDEINIVREGDWCGWPYTSGNGPPVDGGIAPAYVFPGVAAPTGITALNAKEPLMSRGYLLATFVAKALYYIADVDAKPMQLVPVMKGDAGMLIDVVQAATGEIYFASGVAIWRLYVPQRGDCNADGLIDVNDLNALAAALSANGSRVTHDAGSTSVSWGCDANADGVIDERDMAALAGLMSGRLRVVRR
jgi:glucose/arabinose dehydrogenase